MSLMNDALRKKNRETTGSPASRGFIEVSERPRINRRWLVVLAGLSLLTVAVLYGTHLMQSSAGNALLVRTPQPGQSLPPANHPTEKASEVQDRSDGEPLPASADRQTKIVSSEDPPEGIRLAATEPGPVPPSPAVDGDIPGTRVAAPPAALHPVDEKPVSAPAAEKANSAEAPGQGAREENNALSRTFEPGPVQTEPPEKSRPVASRQSRSPALRADSSATDQASGTGGTSNEGAAVRQTDRSNAEEDPFYQKARACHRNGRLAGAIRLYRHVLKAHSSHPDAMLNLAAAYMQQGKYIEATPLLHRLERLSPRPKGVLLNLAMAAIGMGEPEKALNYLDRAAALSDATPWEIRFHRAVAYARMDRLPEALDLYRQAEAERPDDPRLQFNLAVTCDALGFYPQAVNHYEAVLKIPSEPSVTDKATISRRVQTLRRYLDTAQSTAAGK